MKTLKKILTSLLVLLLALLIALPTYAWFGVIRPALRRPDSAMAQGAIPSPAVQFGGDSNRSNTHADFETIIQPPRRSALSVQRMRSNLRGVS
jgi:hypothetical protein